MKIEIEVQNGKVTISVGAQPAPAADYGAITSQGIAGNKQNAGIEGEGVLEDTTSGTGAPGGGTLVIGPIVIDCCCLQGADSGSAAENGTEGKGVLEDTTSGTGAPPTGVVVIGPIVVGGQGRGPAGNGDNQTSTAINAKPAVNKSARRVPA